MKKTALLIFIFLIELEASAQEQMSFKLIFEDYVEFLDRPKDIKPSRLDSMLQANFDPEKMDSTVFKTLLSDDFWKTQAERSKNEVVYEIYPTSVWVYSRSNGQQIGNAFLYKKGAELVEEYDKDRKNLLRIFSAIPELSNATETVFKDDLGKFLDLEVFKVIQTELDPEMGKSIRTQLVTYDILLPVKINLGIGPQLREGLVVENISSTDAFPNMRFVYRLKEVIMPENLN